VLTAVFRRLNKWPCAISLHQPDASRVGLVQQESYTLNLVKVLQPRETPMHRSCIAAGPLLLLSAAVVFGQDEAAQRKKDANKRFDPARLLGQFDANNDGYLDRSEAPERMKERFAQMDANKDGKLSREELQRFAQRGGAAPAASPGDALFRLLDANGDSKLSKEELQKAAQVLDKLDRNKDGMLDQEELAAPSRKKKDGRPGEIITPAAKGERIADKLKVGDRAPAFTLPLVSGKGEVALAPLYNKKPVVLIFASYT
jgi:Ca2+-binding EF-hand superfamily protein